MTKQKLQTKARRKLEKHTLHHFQTRNVLIRALQQPLETGRPLKE